MTSTEPTHDDLAVWEAWGAYDSALKQWFRNGSGDIGPMRAAVVATIRDQAIREERPRVEALARTSRSFLDWLNAHYLNAYGSTDALDEWSAALTAFEESR